MSWRSLEYVSVNPHPPGHTDRFELTPGHPQWDAACQALTAAGFPRPPVTFARGRKLLAPGETTGTLRAVRSRLIGSATDEVACFTHHWSDDPGYRAFFEVVRPPRPFPAGGRWTMPDAATLEARCSFGSPYDDAGRTRLDLVRGGKCRLTVERARTMAQTSWQQAERMLDAAQLGALCKRLAAIKWPHEVPPFDAAAAKDGHTPAELGVKPANDDEGYALARLAWEQRASEPRWAAVFEVLDGLVVSMRAALR